MNCMGIKGTWNLLGGFKVFKFISLVVDLFIIDNMVLNKNGRFY